MAISTIDDVKNLETIELNFYKTTVGNSDYWHDSFLSPGSYPAGVIGDIPALTSPSTCDATTPGSMPVPYGSALSPFKITKANFSYVVKTPTPTTVMLYDRLVHMRSIIPNTTAEQFIGSLSLPRHTNGVGVQIWMFRLSASNSATPNATIKYTNQDGVTGRLAKIINVGPTTANPTNGYRAYQATLQDGDTGVLSVNSITFSATAATPGEYGILLLKPLLFLSSRSTREGQYDFLRTNLVEIPQNASIHVMCRSLANYTSHIKLTIGREV